MTTQQFLQLLADYPQKTSELRKRLEEVDLTLEELLRRTIVTNLLS